jgi:iron complex transport system substrate-binding protein
MRSAAVGVALLAPPASAQPQRVVSINVCTDQLALMLAEPGQLVSVSFLGQDPVYSPLWAQARALPANRGKAEDIVMLRPDLVLAAPFSATATVAMLERLSIPVARIPHQSSLDDVAPALRAVAALLGAEARAEAILAAFDADRALLAAQAARVPRERAATWAARGWTGGTRGLAGDIMDTAGLDNIAGELGLEWGGVLALESLILSEPDLLILGRPTGGGHSQAQALLAHPALAALPAHARGAVMAESDWVCGTPHVLGAVAALIRAREVAP